jgi:peptidase E
MTKYILHGGRTRRESAENATFFEEMIRGLPDLITVLLVLFAREKDRWPDVTAYSQQKFLDAAQGRELRFVIAEDDPVVFVQQLQSSDVIYIPGGGSKKLISWLQKIPNLAKLWKGKVIAGSSAGANALSTYYYCNSDDSIDPGLGILPIKTICHYSDQKADKLQQLKEHGEDFPIIALAEEQWTVMEK